MPSIYRVFVVEDSATIREVLIGSLESSGLVQVVGCADGVDTARNDPRLAEADAVIVDLALPRGNGFELLSILRNTPALARKEKIVLTNYAVPTFRDRAYALGADHFFDKSLEFDQLVELLESRALACKGSPGREARR